MNIDQDASLTRQDRSGSGTKEWYRSDQDAVENYSLVRGQTPTANRRSRDDDQHLFLHVEWRRCVGRASASTMSGGGEGKSQRAGVDYFSEASESEVGSNRGAV